MHDLLTNESFRKWVIDNDPKEAAYWTQWIEEDPSRIELVAAAKAVIMELTKPVAPLTEDEIDEAAAAIQQKLTSQRKPAKLWYAIAASLLIAVAVYLAPTPKDQPYQTFLKENKSLEYANNTSIQQHIRLADGSEVTLEPNSRLSYASTAKREVYLTGTAFFNIARNPAKPFIVYTQTLITKVLGTSFTVYAPPGDNTAKVLVKTGKVSVFKRENFTKDDAASATLKGMVLTANQQIVYDIGQQQMNRSLVDKPTPAPNTKTDFHFEDTPVTQVFDRLQKAYGITIMMDEEVLATCTVTASLGNESFYEKLQMICRIINATYQVIDGNVIIEAKGCQ